MDLKGLRCGIRLAVAIGTLSLVGGAGAQESLDRGKSPAQLFASDCSACHKSPQGLAKAGGLFGLDNFLRTHYTASREAATAIANYLKSVSAGPAGPVRATKRPGKGNEKAQPDDKKKPGVKSGRAKDVETKPDAAVNTSSEPKSSGARPSEPRPADILAPEPKSSGSKPGNVSAGAAKPAERARSERSD